jgi:hypothetical protein
MPRQSRLTVCASHVVPESVETQTAPVSTVAYRMLPSADAAADHQNWLLARAVQLTP